MKHIKLKVHVIKDIKEKSNSREYLKDEILDVQTIKNESDFYEIVFNNDIDMIPKNCVEIVTK